MLEVVFDLELAMHRCERLLLPAAISLSILAMAYLTHLLSSDLLALAPSQAMRGLPALAKADICKPLPRGNAC